MAVKLTHLLSACAIALASSALAGPAIAQSLSLEPEKLSSPPNFSSSETTLSLASSSDDTTASSTEDDTTSDEPSEPTGPALSSPDALKLFVNLCTEVAGGVPNARDDAASAGWIADDPTDSGPYVQIYSGYQELAGYGSIDVWSSLETFPTQRVGYCRVDFGDIDNLIDFKDMAGLGFTGTVTDGGNGNTYGSWESADHKTLLAANRTDGQVQMEFNLLLPLAQN